MTTVEMSLEDEFNFECLRAAQECYRLGYPCKIWLDIMGRKGAYRGALDLVIAGEIQTGFHRLIAMGRPDLTVEYAMLLPRWDGLFARYPDHRDAARWRLAQAGVVVS